MLSRTLIICLACLVQSLPVCAADAKPQQAQSQTFDINFPGGELKTLIEAIKTQNEGVIPNIMMNERAGETHLSPFCLVNVQLLELMDALSIMNSGLRIEPMSDTVFAVSAGDPTAGSYVAIYDIRHLLDPNNPQYFKMDDIATAIRTSWDMIAFSNEPDMKVHQETSLLIIRGGKEEQAIAETVIKQLTGQQKQINTSAATTAIRRQLSVLQKRYDNLVQDMDSLRTENSDLEGKLAAISSATK
jgi:type II secretory pathway component GspD/PulD (secretin)